MEVLQRGFPASYLALRHRPELQDEEDDGLEALVVQRTFLAVRAAPEAPLQPRATSAPPPPSACDRWEQTLAALTNKPAPVHCWPARLEGRARGDGFGEKGEKLQGLLAERGRRGRPEELEEATPSESTVTPDNRSEEAASEAVSLDIPGSVTSAASSQGGLLSQEEEAEEPSLSEALADGSRELRDEDLLRWVPRTACGAPTSIGSLEHADGTCKPCLFAHHASKACSNGLACLFCHFEHPPKRRVKSVYRQRRG